LPKRALPNFEFVSDEMAAVLREKTGAERLEIAFGMIRSARTMLENSLRSQHPDWGEEQVQLEASRRIAARGNE
jgi:hypothetical protein